MNETKGVGSRPTPLDPPSPVDLVLTVHAVPVRLGGHSRPVRPQFEYGLEPHPSAGEDRPACPAIVAKNNGHPSVPLVPAFPFHSEDCRPGASAASLLSNSCFPGRLFAKDCQFPRGCVLPRPAHGARQRLQAEACCRRCGVTLFPVIFVNERTCTEVRTFGLLVPSSY